MICDVVTPDGKPYEGDPRYVLKRALERMREHGLRHVQRRPRARVLLFQETTTATEILDHGGYFDLTTLDVGRPSGARRRSRRSSRWGSRSSTPTTRSRPSQHEIDMRYADALEMADHTVTYRLIVKEIASKYGIYATFMPKPLFGENGSGMHTHQSLFATGRTRSTTPTTSGTCRRPASTSSPGQLHHAREICAIFAQWVNSYKRLVPGYEAPVYVAWSRRNRSALIRIPLYHPARSRRRGPRSAARTRPATRT